MYEKLITKVLAGEATEEEERLLTEWQEQDEENKNMVRELSETWHITGTPNLINKINTSEAYNKVKERVQGQAVVKNLHDRNVFKPLWKYAAVILVFIALGFLIFNHSQKTEIVAGDEIKEIILPDQSKVSLNRYSMLSYNKSFGKTHRNLLLRGEAFFEVAKDTATPFIIKTTNAEVEVLGTSFNVNAYEREKVLEVVVSSGKVELRCASGRALKAERRIIIEPGFKGLLNKQNASLQKGFNDDINYLSWKTGIIRIDNLTLKQATDILNHVYFVNIRFSDPDLEVLQWNVTLDHEPLDKVLKIMSKTFNLNYSKRDNDIIFSKK